MTAAHHAEADAAVEPTFTVGELAVRINATLKAGLGDRVWVRGEIQGYRVSGAHAYFTLADTSGPTPAVLNVQLFAPVRTRLRPMLASHRLELADGIAVRICGQLDFWAQGGRLGLKMTDLDPRFTLGEIALTREAVLAALATEGLLGRNAARPLAPVPLRLVVLTSVGSAAWHDFSDELARSGMGFLVQAVDCRVQGEDAVPMITAALQMISARVESAREQDAPGEAALDAVVLIRGGGARNELATFDDPAIARAIAACPVPVMTGIGHEVDRAVADEVAHTALKTPTACAGFLVDRVREFLGHLDERGTRIRAAAERAVTTADRIGRVEADLAAQVQRILERAGLRLDTLEARVRAHDPAVMLARGWSISQTADGRIVRSVHDLSPGTVLITRLSDGLVTAAVTQVEPVGDTEQEDDHDR